MFNVNLEYIDELYNICGDMCVIAYLQSLVEYDDNVNGLIEEFSFTRKNTEIYLLKAQNDNVLQLKELLDKKILPLKNN